MAAKTAAIKLKRLTKHYGKSLGIEAVDLTVEPGEIFGFLGPNGAGKSTTINILLDIIHPTSGGVWLFGQPNTGNTAKLRRDIGYLSGDMELYPTLTGWQYVQFVRRISGNLSLARAKELAVRLDADLRKKIHTLSHGNRQKVGLIAALARDTKLLILDEPTSGLDPLIQQEFNQLMREYRAAGGTVFISSHILGEVQTLCDHVAFIRDGRIVDVGELHMLLGNVPKRITIQAPRQVLDKIAQVHGVKLIDGHAQFDVQGNPAHVLAKLPLDKIQDITVAPPELEEIFMGFYESAKPPQETKQ